jgi:serine/threonine protein phosphatase PrpC
MVILLSLVLLGLLLAGLLGAFKGRRPDAEAPEPFPLPPMPENQAWNGGLSAAPAAAPSPLADDLPRGDGPREGSIAIAASAAGPLVARFAARTHQGAPDGITTHRAVALPPAGVLFVTDGFGVFGPGMTNAVAADAIRNAVAASYRGGHAGEILASAISSANNELAAFIRDHREFAGGGATVAAVALSPRGSVVAHVGAERVYRARAGRLEQLTEDHSLINDFIRMKSITDEEEKRTLRRDGPHRNVIVRALGPKEGIQADVAELDLRPGDRILLATKGVGDALLEDEIQALLTALGPAEALCEAILSEAVKAAPLKNHALIAIAIESAG